MHPFFYLPNTGHVFKGIGCIAYIFNGGVDASQDNPLKNAPD